MFGVSLFKPWAFLPNLLKNNWNINRIITVMLNTNVNMKTETIINTHKNAMTCFFTIKELYQLVTNQTAVVCCFWTWTQLKLTSFSPSVVLPNCDSRGNWILLHVTTQSVSASHEVHCHNSLSPHIVWVEQTIWLCNTRFWKVYWFGLDF